MVGSRLSKVSFNVISVVVVVNIVNLVYGTTVMFSNAVCCWYVMCTYCIWKHTFNSTVNCNLQNYGWIESTHHLSLTGRHWLHLVRLCCRAIVLEYNTQHYISLQAYNDMMLVCEYPITFCPSSEREQHLLQWPVKSWAAIISKHIKYCPDNSETFTICLKKGH